MSHLDRTYRGRYATVHGLSARRSLARCNCSTTRHSRQQRQREHRRRREGSRLVLVTVLVTTLVTTLVMLLVLVAVWTSVWVLVDGEVWERAPPVAAVSSVLVVAPGRYKSTRQQAH